MKLCEMSIRVVKPGFFTTVQDLGRYGYAHLGISPAGAADPLSLRIANLLVGNEENDSDIFPDRGDLAGQAVLRYHRHICCDSVL